VIVPQTAQQILILLLLVLPGFFYQGARERLHGPAPGGVEITRRLARAIAASVVFDAIYLVAIGPWLVELMAPQGGVVTGLAFRPRQTGLSILVLIVGIPTAVALGEFRLSRRARRGRFADAPTAWDGLFRDRSECLVRIQLKSGGWVGGWYSTSSWASSFPQPADLYLQAQYVMRADGTFGPLLPGTGGVYVNGSEIEVLEIIEAGSRKGAKEVDDGDE
jgi:Family of unknown function (DUF6338)